MTATTSRSPSPAADTRHGTGFRALPHDPGLDALLADPRLGTTAKLVAVALAHHWAWRKDHCWPADATIAARVGKSPGHVQRCLRELERAGYIAREATADVPNGRRIWLLWRRPGSRAGAGSGCAPAHTLPPAPARTEPVVIVNEGREPEIPPASRPRPEPDPVPAVAPGAVPTPPPDPQAGRPPLLTREPREGPSGGAAVAGPPPPGGHGPVRAVNGIPETPSAPPALPPFPPPGGPEKPAGGCEAPRTSPGGGVPRAASSSPPPPRGLPRRKPLGLSLEELSRVVGETGDPILAAELARRTAPPAPPEPPPGALPTAELLARLPGRHDLIGAAVQRLCAELSDWKPATWSFCEKAVVAVVSRRVPCEVLLDCHRQATGPCARDRGRLFVAAWKRESGRGVERGLVPPG